MPQPKYYIGCSGYYYPNWKKEFYPQKLPPSKWLEYYSTIFNTVELNGTFYRLPKLTDLKKQFERTPANFKFSVKVSRFITHIKRLKDSKDLITEFSDLIHSGLENKLHRLLFQMPPSFHYSEENLENIMNNIPQGHLHVIEFRHQSWWNDTTIKALKKNKIVFCNVDYPGLQNPPVNTTKEFYMRFHGVPELFKSEYTQHELEVFAAQFPKSNSYTVYFNNTASGAGYRNAMQLINLLK